MRQLKFRAWDKKKKKFVYNFILAPTTPDWSAFPYEKAKDLERYQNEIHEKIGDIDEDWKWKLVGFTTSEYSIFDWANYYGTMNYVVEQFINKVDKNNKDVFEGDLFKAQVLCTPDGLSSAHNITYWVDVICTVTYCEEHNAFMGKYKINKKKFGDHIISNREGYVSLPSSLEIIGNMHESK